jgi:hypothetical protein
MARHWFLLVAMGFALGCASPAEQYNQAVEEYRAAVELHQQMELELDERRYSAQTHQDVAAREQFAIATRAQFKKAIAAKLRVDRLAERLPPEAVGQ